MAEKSKQTFVAALVTSHGDPLRRFLRTRVQIDMVGVTGSIPVAPTKCRLVMHSRQGNSDRRQQ